MEPQCSSLGFLGITLPSFRRNQVASMEPGQEDDLQELYQFQTNLLDALVSCQEDFGNLLLLLLDRNPAILVKPPLDRLVPDLLDRAVKALDVLNAVSLSLHALHHFNRQAHIAATAAGQSQLPRARRALSKLLDETLPRSRSGRGSGSGRSLSWSLSRSWSTPRGVGEPFGGGIAGGIGIAVHTLSTLINFTMFVLAAAVPCVGGAAAPVAPLRQLQWSATMVGLQERIAEEWRRNEKKGSGSLYVGLLAELQGVDIRSKCLMECVNETQEGERKSKVAATGAELAEACWVLEEGMGPFEKKVRAVSLRMFSSRSEVVRCLDRSTRSASAASASPTPPAL
ncbi:protein ROH1A-like [Typha latifolia]|uniref:protein ROH1A-like n=1 Tax=Typha latifolia TaxID=4733 RepID=UPI003C2BF65A